MVPYNDMPVWLPRTVDKFGQRYSGPFDSGVNYLFECQDEVVATIEMAGVTVRFDGLSLEDLFEPM